MSDPQRFDVREDRADVWADQDAPFAERLQYDGDAGRVDGITNSAAAIWIAACGAIAFGATAFAAVVYWTAGGC